MFAARPRAALNKGSTQTLMCRKALPFRLCARYIRFGVRLPPAADFDRFCELKTAFDVDEPNDPKLTR